MSKVIAIALLVAGVILLYFGYEASQSVSSEVSEAFTGEPTDNAIWFLIGGAIAVVVGLYGLIRGK